MSFNHYTAGHNESKRSCPINSALILISTMGSPGCHVHSLPCERKTLETVKELLGNFMCWKGTKGYSPYTSLCPHYRRVGWVFFFDWRWKRWLGVSAEKPPHSFTSDSFPKEAAAVPEWEGGGPMGEVICSLNCLCSVNHKTAALLDRIPALICSVRIKLYSIKEDCLCPN